MIEIERKFLVKSDAFKQEARKESYMVQGFLNSHPDRTVRIRIFNNKGYLTVKGRSNVSGTTRFEWEKVIGRAEARALLSLCEEGMIEKTRYEVEVGNGVFEVDEFHGINEGLVMAEIELDSEQAAFEKPEWLGEEVTGDNRYYNSSLTKQPYKTWKDEA